MPRKIDQELIDACTEGRLHDVDRLIKEGADDCVKYGDWGQTPLHLAAGNGHEPVVSALLSHGVYHGIYDNNDDTPLHWAAGNGHEPVVTVLLSHGADCNAANDLEETPLHLAAKNGHEPVVLALLSQGADPNVADDEGETPLHLAATNGHESVVSALLSHGANCNKADKRGQTPLHLAAWNGHEPVVSVLLSHKADCNAADISGQTPLHLAAWRGHETVVSALLSHGVDHNVADDEGATPLHLAARNGGGPGVSALLSHGADPNVADKRGETPYDVCSRYFEAKELLQEALQFPRELQYLSVQDDDTFTNTLKSGYYESHVGKLMCVGPEGVGKTAIVSVLRDVKPSETRIPTEGIDLHTYKAAINTGTMEWVPSVSKAEDVAIRDPLFEPKQEKQVSSTKFDYDEYLSHDLESMKNEQTAKGVSPLDKSDKSRKKKTVKPLPSNQNIAMKDAIDKRETRKVNHPRKDEPKYKSIYLLREVQKYAKSKEGLLDRALAPVNMMDFGGQAAFYSTHQSFLTYRGLYVLVLDGSKGFDEVIDTEDFIPGRHGKPTAREFTFFLVSSILAYSKGASKNFPKILVVFTHKDKVASNEADQKAEQNFLEIEKMFSNTSAEKHLIMKPRLFLNAMDPNDSSYNTLKEVLVEQMCSQPSWGEKLPKAWIPLKMIINQKVEQGEMIMSLEELQAVNEQNPVQKLSEEELATFLKIHHAQGEIIHFPIRELKDYIIISPEFLVAALRSLVTDKRFCKGRRMTALESMNQSGVLCDSDIEYIWEGEGRFMQHKQYLLSLLSHLDIIATPRNYRPDGSFQESDTHYVPCLVSGVVDISELDINFERRSIGISFKFESKILPPAIGYRLMASCIDMYPIQRYKKGSMLFCGIVMLSVNRRIDLLVILRSDRIDFFLIHEKFKDDIPKPIAISTLDCLKDILVNILESYRKTSSEGKYILSVPFQVEFPCKKVSSPCYDTDRTKDSPTCKHGHTLSLEDKDKWFMNTRKELIKTAARTECPSVGLPPFELKGKPTDRLLADMSIQMMEEEMRILVVQLGLKHYEIDSIMADNRGDLMNIKFLLLRKWKQKTNGGSIEELVKAAENEGISFERIHKMNRDKPVPEGINESDENLNDEILDSVANKVINESLLFSVYLGLDPLFWIKLRKKRYDIYEINREVLEKWRQSGDYKMKNLVQALCNVDNIYALSLDS